MKIKDILKKQGEIYKNLASNETIEECNEKFLKLLKIVNLAEEYVLKYGIKEKGEPYKYDSGEKGCDAVIVHSTSEIYTVILDDFEIRLKDKHTSREYGTYSREWIDRDTRILEIISGQKKLISAGKILGGEEGSGGVLTPTKTEKIEPTEWRVYKAENLEQVMENLEKIKEQKIDCKSAA